jgi:hypothetical protein
MSFEAFEAFEAVRGTWEKRCKGCIMITGVPSISYAYEDITAKVIKSEFSRYRSVLFDEWKSFLPLQIPI